MNPFDLKAAEWDDNPGRVENTRKIAAAIKQAVPLSKTRSAMEFGCGTGLVSRELLPLIACPEQGRRGRILAIDLSPGMIAQLQNRIAEAGLQNITAQCLDIFTAPPAGRMKAVCSQAATVALGAKDIFPVELVAAMRTVVHSFFRFADIIQAGTPLRF